MEGLAENTLSEFEYLGLCSSYDVDKNSFIVGSISNNHLHEQHEGGGGVPVRQVTERKLKTTSENKHDVFTGLIDGVTGEPLHGTRKYVLTGEIYEGPFRNDGKRHGKDVVVKNISLAKPNHDGLMMYVDSSPQQDEGELLGPPKITCCLSFMRANFFGSYANDEPEYGTLVTDSFTYRGHFQKRLFHGINGEIIHCSGYKYTGEFRDGLLHGTGRESEPVTGEYQGEFRFGARDGYGTFKSKIESSQQEGKSTQQAGEETIDGWSNRYIYSGFYRRGQKHGEGTEWTPEGGVYTGSFAANERHGPGTLKLLRTGITYEGQWRAGKPVDGNGWRVLYPSGDTYVGEVVNFQPHGYGIYKYANGDSFSGNFLNGQRDGNGIFSDANGTEFSGTWSQDVRVSMSRLEETDGTLSEIAETLRINDEESIDTTGNVCIEKDVEDSDSSKHDKQLVFLKQAMAKSLEKSLQIITHQPAETVEDQVRKSQSRKSRRRKSIAKDGSEQTEGKAELHCYANGDSYLGALDPETKQRNGYGVYVSKGSRCTYTGEFHKGLRSGYGVLIHSEYGKYAGEFWEDRKHGVGTLILSDGSSYHGSFRKGVFEGKGTLCERDGTVYVGQWKGGLRHGEGMETMSDGRVYQGSFYNGRKDGAEGTLLDKTGGKVIYRGSWRDGMYHGEGVLFVRNSSDPLDTVCYEGSFSHGKRHGFGSLTCDSEGTVCKGMFSNDEPVHGKWRISYSDGSIFSGQARVLGENELCSALRDHHIIVAPEGFGNKKFSNGNIYVGPFKDGKRHGTGSCMFASGDQWEGNWINDEIDKESLGTLRVTLADGSVREYASNRPIM